MSDLKARKEAQSVGAKYDELPYLSKAFYHTSPEHLCSMARLFSVNAPDIENSKVLDLGGGTGANLFSFAMNYPKAKILGVELSSKEVEEGNKHIKALGLKNYDLKAMSILDIDESYGKFDYIICHGVFAWVPKDVQDKILDITGKQLTPNGVAMISYNTLPGWNSINAFRHMLQFHSRYFDSNEEKIAQSKALLSFMQDVLKDSDSAYSQYLQKECDVIKTSDDSFLFHEYIEKGNTEFYFSDFIEMASKHGLTYLAEASLASMNPNNLPPKAAAKLSEVTDIIKQEQYMDFVFDRRFRNTLLCNSSAKMNRNINVDSMKDMYFALPVGCDIALENVDFAAKDFKISFKLGESACEAKSPMIAAALFAFVQNPGASLSIEDIKDFISTNCKALEVTKDTANAILSDFINMIFSGVMQIRASKPKHIWTVTQKPKVSDLVRYQAEKGFPFVFNQNNETLDINNIYSSIYSNMDGTKTIDDLAKIIDKKFEESGQFLEIEGKRVTEEKLKFKLLTEIALKALHFARIYGLLVG